MKLTFESLSELREFMTELDGDGSDDAAEAATGTTKRRRRTKAEIEAANAAQGQPNPPQAPQGNSGFGPPPTANAAPPATGFAAPPPSSFAPPAQPEANPMVKAIIDKTEAAMKAGQPMEAVVGWFRAALGPETAQANWEQMKAAFLPKASDALLKQIASQLGVIPAAA